MPKKLTSFSEVVGHQQLIPFLEDHIENGTLSQFLLFEGQEGLGKSSLAKLVAYYLTQKDPQVLERVLLGNKSTENVLIYNMSINGGKDVAKEVAANLSLGLSDLTTKVIILDEAHAMSEAAQDVFLVSTEFLPKGVYVFMCTTDALTLKPTLKSRALTLHLNPLSHREMVQLLTDVVHTRNLKLQVETASIGMLASWAEGKPRIALNLLEGFREGTAISSDMLKGFIDYLDVDDVVPLIACLAGSMTQGLSYISDMKLNNSFIPLLVEIFKVHKGQASFKLTASDVRLIRQQLACVPTDNFMRFLCIVAGGTLSRQLLLSAFLQSHVDLQALQGTVSREEVLQGELQQKFEKAPSHLETHRANAPDLDDLLRKGAILE